MIHKGYSLSIPTSANQRLSVPNEQPEWHPLLPALRTEPSPSTRVEITLWTTL